MSSFWDSSWNGPLSSDELFVSFWQLVRKNNTKREHTHRNTKDFFVFFFENVLFVEFVVVTGYLVGHYWNKNILSLRFPALLTGRCIILWVCRKKIKFRPPKMFWCVGCFQETRLQWRKRVPSVRKVIWNWVQWQQKILIDLELLVRMSNDLFLRFDDIQLVVFFEKQVTFFLKKASIQCAFTRNY